MLGRAVSRDRLPQGRDDVGLARHAGRPPHDPAGARRGRARSASARCPAGGPGPGATRRRPRRAVRRRPCRRPRPSRRRVGRQGWQNAVENWTRVARSPSGWPRSCGVTRPGSCGAAVGAARTAGCGSVDAADPAVGEPPVDAERRSRRPAPRRSTTRPQRSRPAQLRSARRPIPGRAAPAPRRARHVSRRRTGAAPRRRRPSRSGDLGVRPGPHRVAVDQERAPPQHPRELPVVRVQAYGRGQQPRPASAADSTCSSATPAACLAAAQYRSVTTRPRPGRQRRAGRVGALGATAPRTQAAIRPIEVAADRRLGVAEPGLDPQLRRRARRLGELARVVEREVAVRVAVHDQERRRRDAAGDGARLLRHRVPALGHDPGPAAPSARRAGRPAARSTRCSRRIAGVPL